MGTPYTRYLRQRRREGVGPPFQTRWWKWTVHRVLPHWDRTSYLAVKLGRPIQVTGHPDANRYRHRVRQHLIERREEVLWARIPVQRDDMVFGLSRFHERVLRTGPWDPHPSHTRIDLGIEETGICGTIRIWSLHPRVEPPFIEYFEPMAGKRHEAVFRILIEDLVLAKVQNDEIAGLRAPTVRQWVQLNQQMLLTFWRKAVWWNCGYEEKFTKHFKRLSL
jgi:hypothetical protein